MSVFDGIVMKVIDVSFHILFVTQGVFPITSLPDTPFAFVYAPHGTPLALW